MTVEDVYLDFTLVPLELMRQTVVRWDTPDPKYVPLLRAGGITAVVTSPDESFVRACNAAGIQVTGEADVGFVSLTGIGSATPGTQTVVKAGVWPGVQRPDPQTAGATVSLWLNQNCSLVNYLRALYPHATPVLGYRPDQDAGVSPNYLLPFDSLELALVEAWVSGGNYVMTLDARFQRRLLNGAADALAAWQKLGRTANWLRTNESLFRQQPLPIVTVLVDDSDVSLEIAHLCYRQNVSPALVAASDPPAPDPAHRRVLVAAGIAAPKGDARKRILGSAWAGTTVVVDGSAADAWWREPGLKPVRSDHDRDYYSFGKGQLVAYKEAIDDPGMFALDVIDIVTQKRRPARIWNSNAGLVIATRGTNTASSTSALLHIINYGHPDDLPTLARIQGAFHRATLLRPEARPLDLRVSPRGTGSEVEIPRLNRVATVVFA